MHSMNPHEASEYLHLRNQTGERFCPSSQQLPTVFSNRHSWPSSNAIYADYVQKSICGTISGQSLARKSEKPNSRISLTTSGLTSFCNMWHFRVFSWKITLTELVILMSTIRAAKTWISSLSVKVKRRQENHARRSRRHGNAFTQRRGH